MSDREPVTRSPGSLDPGNTAKTKPQPVSDRDVCPRCGESSELAQIKGCLRCLKCGFKWDCNGW